MPEQEKIAEILSTWDEAIEGSSVNIKRVNRFGQALIGHLIASNTKTSDRISLAELVEINPSSAKVSDDLEVTFLGMADVSEAGEIQNLNTRKYAEVKKGFTGFGESDTLVAKITPCFENGKGCLANGLKNKIGFGSTEFHVLRPKAGVDPRIPFYLSRSYEFRKRGAMFMTGSAGQKRVPTEFIEQFLVKDARKQNLSVSLDLIESVFSYGKTLEKNLIALKKQKQGLMQKLLTGKLRVKV